MSATVAAIAAGTGAMAGEGDSHVEANNLYEQLTGYEENPVALSTTGKGQFQAHINEQAQEISYQLSYTNLEGAVTQAHIHFGGQSQVGGISVLLCSNLLQPRQWASRYPGLPGGSRHDLRNHQGG